MKIGKRIYQNIELIKGNFYYIKVNYKNLKKKIITYFNAFVFIINISNYQNYKLINKNNIFN
jgi:hypothetical protein